MQRQVINKPLDSGVRAINAMLTLGAGQRIGLFAGSGVGKSTLLGMISRYTAADVVVVGLVGERGREVREFIDSNMTEEMRSKAVVVAAPADQTPLMRVRAATLATSIAESFRDQGKQVLLLLDSLSRFALAHREMALAAGELPTSRGYPSSALAKLPALVERAGNGSSGKGSMTAIYTILTDGEGLQDPIAETARAILDGHIVLSRSLADAGHFPAIDVAASVSRVMPQVCDKPHIEASRRIRQWQAAYTEVKDLLAIGAYRSGTDANADTAIAKWPFIQQFLQQDVDTGQSLQQSVDLLYKLAAPEQSLPAATATESDNGVAAVN